MDRRTFLLSGAAATSGLLLPRSGRAASRVVRVGLVLPLSGPDAARGRMARNGALLAIDEVNRRSGNRLSIISLVDDSRSDAKSFLSALNRMVNHEKALSVFGLCPEGAREPMLGIVEKAKGLFWDCGPNPGGECSKHVVNCGPTPHQSLKHLVPWVVANVGPRLLPVGGTDALGRELLRVAMDNTAAIGGKPLDPMVIKDRDGIGKAIARVRNGGVDAVLSTLSGEAAGDLLRAWRAHGIDPRHIPIVSPTLSEIEVAAAGPGNAFGAIAAQPYFSSWASPENWRFMDRMRRHHGAKAAPSALAEAMWFQIHLLAEALGNLADGDLLPLNLREAAKDREVAAPQGRIRVEGGSLHTVLWPKIAVAEPSGRFRILARASQGLRPLPFWAHPGKACTGSGPAKAQARHSG